MAPGHMEGLVHLQSLAEDDNFHGGENGEAPNMVNMEGVLEGSERVELSHAGGELGSLEQDLEEDSGNDDPSRRARRAEDWRTRRDRTETRNRAFDSQMPELVSAYIRHCAEGEMPARPMSDEVREALAEEIYTIQVVDMFGKLFAQRIVYVLPILQNTRDVEVKLKPAGGIGAALVLEGLMPCVPWSPTVAFKIRVLEMYRVTHVRCPQLAVQSFVKSLCDLHGIVHRPYLCQQFSIAYDLYLAIRRETDDRVMNILGRDSTWRLKHTCPACMYKLEGEDDLIFNMLTTMDGNNSLKRVLRREKRTMADEEADDPKPADSRERVDNRDAGDGYFLSREKVERWARTRLADMLPMEGRNSTEDNPCADRWKNMITDVTSKMWGIFDETGIFLALCRHGFVLVIADMIRSGELSKYPLAVVEELLEAFGMKLGAGYDVGCDFQSTVANSELGGVAREKKLRCLVGSFHGHAHNRLCQLGFLATYVEGMGLEDLEGCERFFFSIKRPGKIVPLCESFPSAAGDIDLREALRQCRNANFFARTTIRALTILKSEATLRTWMRQEGIESYDEFHRWLEEEKAYLVGLKNNPQTNTETLEMEYVQKLVNLSASQAKYSVLVAEARHARGDDGSYAPGVGKAEIARRHGKDKLDRDSEAVEDLEVRLDIVERWTTASPQWASTVAEVKKRKYRLALGALELLIVERIFELTKMNQSQTGYKMRKHIAKALQARSKAVKSAIDNYNSAARALDPPMPMLGWEQVVEYAFLADFDMLRDTNVEIQSRPWTLIRVGSADPSSGRFLRFIT
ncbi:hypothetical protein B0H15DRAFT_956756 [Mycena belliarum]|uniref:CxC1-like cysteine cluster associated with KDZ transposases domain-containing protein n=1 Tax=Mycena belliarum TaxID=1033014 RepID=A0AAD6TQJ7_9AGAR|nr:hypothetical protein B0H15DRAFT_956756 [Mycena belliae]